MKIIMLKIMKAIDSNTTLKKVCAFLLNGH